MSLQVLEAQGGHAERESHRMLNIKNQDQNRKVMWVYAGSTGGETD